MQPAFSKNIAKLSGNVIREILKLTQQTDIISFAGGMPPDDSFPIEALKDISSKVIDKYGSSIFQYGTSEGFMPLREFIVTWMAAKGVNTVIEEVLITSGSQQGIDLLSKVFIDSGDGVILENPTYLAAIQIFNLYGARFSPGESDDLGFIPQSLNKAIENNISKLLYLVPSFQNPTGISLARERRQELAELLSRFDIVMIEDDPYGDLRYSGEAIIPVKSFDKDRRIVYLGSFSKTIAPGLRVGFAVGPKDIIRKMVIGKQASDVHSCNLAQAMIYEFCAQGLLKPHIESLIVNYRKKRDLMLKMINKYFPPSTSWTIPEGGLFIWAKLPDGASASDLFKLAIEEKVAFIPGNNFYASGGGENSLRLNFSNASEEQIEDGINRLGRALDKYLS
ncbi:MAG: PLP-dependent aminotransferase family protein [Firmicutes bacterium]|nr:PLP-dependent aminotransferase family protein [Bacillota bacterium]